eukprot:5908214-Amphidinium_carterae.2
MADHSGAGDGAGDNVQLWGAYKTGSLATLGDRKASLLAQVRVFSGKIDREDDRRCGGKCEDLRENLGYFSGLAGRAIACASQRVHSLRKQDKTT